MDCRLGWFLEDAKRKEDYADKSSSIAEVDIRVRVSGGGHTSQVYAIRQAIAKSIVRHTNLHMRPFTRGKGMDC